MKFFHSFVITISVCAVLFGAVMFSASTHAQTQEKDPCGRFGCFEVLDQLSFGGIFWITKNIENSAQPENAPLTSLANAIFQIGIVVLVMISLIMIVLGGYVYMTAGGNTSQIGTAKTIIGSALLGITLALTGWLILNTVSSQFTNPQEPTLQLPPAPAP